jgi:hypothetical protein
MGHSFSNLYHRPWHLVSSMALPPEPPASIDASLLISFSAAARFGAAPMDYPLEDGMPSLISCMIAWFQIGCSTSREGHARARKGCARTDQATVGYWSQRLASRASSPMPDLGSGHRLGKYLALSPLSHTLLRLTFSFWLKKDDCGQGRL